MKNEYKYLTLFVLSVVLTVGLFNRILTTQYPEATTSFISSCQAIGTTLISNKAPLILFGYFVSIMFLLRIIISIIKTTCISRKFGSSKSINFPNSLNAICEKNNFNQNKIRLIKSDKVFAVTIGVLNKEIIFSTKLVETLNEKELEAVFLHELYYYEHNHGLIISFAEVVTESLFFLPTLKDFLAKMKSSFEKQADSSAIFKQKNSTYLKSALATIISDDNINTKQYSHIFPRFAAVALSERILAINSYEQKTENSIISPIQNLNIKRLTFSLLIISVAASMPYFINKTSASEIISTYDYSPDNSTVQNCTLLECVSTCIAEELPNSKLLQTPNLIYSPAE